MDQPTSTDQQATESRKSGASQVEESLLERRDIQFLFLGIFFIISCLGLGKLFLTPTPPVPTVRHEDDVSTGFRVNVNTATVEELQLLPKVGPVLAERIKQERECNGPFKTVEDLARTPGIGPERVTSFRPMIDTSTPSGSEQRAAH